MQKNNQMDLFHFDDLMADVASENIHHGARKFLMEFHTRYPDLYEELKTQINRDHRQTPALLKPDAPSLWCKPTRVAHGARAQ